MYVVLFRHDIAAPLQMGVFALHSDATQWVANYRDEIGDRATAVILQECPQQGVAGDRENPRLYGSVK